MKNYFNLLDRYKSAINFLYGVNDTYLIDDMHYDYLGYINAEPKTNLKDLQNAVKKSELLVKFYKNDYIIKHA